MPIIAQYSDLLKFRGPVHWLLVSASDAKLGEVEIVDG